MSMDAQARSEQVSDPSRDRTGFYSGLPIFRSFENLTDPSIYTPLPPGWLIGTSDIVRSTAAIEAGRYKVVNTAAASVIVAVANALKNNDFPFVFGGDGAGFALPPHLRSLAAAGARRRGGMGARRVRPRTTGRHGLGRRVARSGVRRAGGALCSLAERILRDVHRRRPCLCGAADEGR